MGKKSKALKIKQYKVPEEKFVVVTDLWAIYKNLDDADFNHIGAWFDRMLRDESTNTRIKAIYYQRTHRNIIVELPKEVKDVEPFLGAHFYSKIFLGAEQSEEAACIYEYRYATFGDPTKKTFGVEHPKDDKIHDLPIRHPYPLPSPAPPPRPDVPYARPIPHEVNERIANRLRDRTCIEFRTPGPSVGITVSSSPSPNEPNPVDDFIPYVRPSHLNPTLTDNLKKSAPVDSSRHPKMDPYDEEEEREKSLLKASDSNNEEEAFLAAIIVKTEVTVTLDSHAGAYKPSAELLDALSSLPEELDVQVKAEETKERIKLEPTEEVTLSSNADYQPSADLLIALATLPESVNFTDEMEWPAKSASSLSKRRIQEIVHGTQIMSPKRIKTEDSEL